MKNFKSILQQQAIKEIVNAELKLHQAAAAYASNRKNAYVEAMMCGAVPYMNEKILNEKLIAHYEGYQEGYRAATGDTKFSTDPAKLKEKNR